jgi:hypothetical protein
VESAQYNSNKPNILIDVHKCDVELMKTMYGVPEDKISYWVNIQNPGNSKQSIKQVNLEICFNGTFLGTINQGNIPFQYNVGNSREAVGTAARIQNGGNLIEFDSYSLTVEDILPGGVVNKIVVIEPQTSGYYYYLADTCDCSWYWELNGEEKIETEHLTLN